MVMSPCFSPDLALYFYKCLCASFAAATAAAVAAATVFKENGLLNLSSKASSLYNEKCDRNIHSDSFQAPGVTKLCMQYNVSQIPSRVWGKGRLITPCEAQSQCVPQFYTFCAFAQTIQYFTIKNLIQVSADRQIQNFKWHLTNISVYSI